MIVLNGGIDKHAKIVQAKSNDLNRVFQAQRVVNQYQLVEKSKEEQREERWDGLDFWWSRGNVLDEAHLEFRKDVSLSQSVRSRMQT